MTPQGDGAGLKTVERRPDQIDRRAKLITLTVRGHVCIAAGISTIQGIEDRITPTLGECGHRRLRILLRKLLDAG